MPIIRSLTG